MNAGTLMTITPAGDFAQAFATAALSLQADTDHSWSHRLARSSIQVRTVIGTRPIIQFQTAFRASDEFIGKNAVVEQIVQIPMYAQLAAAKAALRRAFPDLTSAIDNLSIHDAVLENQELRFFFALDDAAECNQVFLDLLRHVLVSLDAIELDVLHVHHGKRRVNLRPRVRLDGQRRWVFQARAAWGTVEVSRVIDAIPLLQQENAAAIRHELSRLLLITVNLDPAKFPWGETGISASASSWSEPGDHHPAQVVLNCVRRELWLDTELAVDPAAVDVIPLNEHEKRIFDAHVSGKRVRAMPPMNSDDRAFEKMRDKFVEKIGVDLAVPFAVAQHNRSAVLGKILSDQRLFDATEHPLLADLSLNRGNARRLFAVFEESLAAAASDTVVGGSKHDDVAADADVDADAA